MIELPPPQPPSNSDRFLHDLIDYYRALLDYHQKLATQAASSLAHIEALLNAKSFTWQQSQPLERVSYNGKQNDISTLEEIAPTIEEFLTLERPDVDVDVSLPSLDHIEELFKVNRGKMLHLDYIVRVLCGHLEGETLERVTEEIVQMLELGVSQGKWFAILDSPNCWTLSLEDFPELTSEKTINKVRTRRKLISRLPDNGKVHQYPTLTDAIVACLQENAPKALTINQMLDWFYPEGMPTEDKKRARQAIRDIVMKKCGRDNCWKRVGTGIYTVNFVEI
jgi:hypothetical protein